MLVHVLSALKMLHPFMPFITEEIYLHLPGTEGTTATAPRPEADEALTLHARREGAVQPARKR